nr:hypothetical protein [Nocardia abscessus]
MYRPAGTTIVLPGRELAVCTAARSVQVPATVRHCPGSAATPSSVVSTVITPGEPAPGGLSA